MLWVKMSSRIVSWKNVNFHWCQEGIKMLRIIRKEIKKMENIIMPLCLNPSTLKVHPFLEHWVQCMCDRMKRSPEKRNKNEQRYEITFIWGEIKQGMTQDKG